MPRPIDTTEKIYCVEYRIQADDPAPRRYICKAVDPKEAAALAQKAVGRDILIDHTPRVMSRSAASAALTMFAGFTGAI